MCSSLDAIPSYMSLPPSPSSSIKTYLSLSVRHTPSIRHTFIYGVQSFFASLVPPTLLHLPRPPPATTAAAAAAKPVPDWKNRCS